MSNIVNNRDMAKQKHIADNIRMNTLWRIQAHIFH